MIKNVLFTLVTFGLTIFISCGDVVFSTPTDPDNQLELDIAVIEEFIAQEGFLDYDTLDSEVRVVVLDEGTGNVINYNDIIFYDYIGSFIDSLIFDSSIGEIALAQDQENALDTTYLKSQVNTDLDSLDDDGNKIIINVTFNDDYRQIFALTRVYEEFITTHTPDGWFIQQDGLVNGFKDGVHYTLENVKVGGRVLALIPSGQAYGPSGTFGISPNTPIMFEIIVNRIK